MFKPKNAFITGVIFGILGAVGFSLKAIIAKLMYRIGGIDAISILTLRMSFALPLYLSIELVRTILQKDRLLPFYKIVQIALIGCLGYYLASWLDFWGLEYISASLERIILYAYPTFVLFLGYLFFNKKIYSRQIIALIIIYSGIFIAYYSDIQIYSLESTIVGFLLILACTFSFSLYVLFSEKQIPNIGVIKFTNYAMILSTCAIIVHYSIYHKGIAPLLQYDYKIYEYTFIMAVFCTVLPSYLTTKAIKLLGASNLAIIGGTGPIITVIAAIIFLDEQLTIYYSIGCLLVIYGILFLKRKPPKND